MPIFVPSQHRGHRTLPERELKDFFRRHDTDGDGRLSKEELKMAFKSLGAVSPGWRAGRALAHADSNGDGFISGEEMDQLVQYVHKFGHPWPAVRRRDIKDAKISEEAFEYLSAYIPGYRSGHRRRSYGDVCGNGYSSKEELRNLIASAVKFGYEFKYSDFIREEKPKDEESTDGAVRRLPVLRVHVTAKGGGYISEEEYL